MKTIQISLPTSVCLSISPPIVTWEHKLSFSNLRFLRSERYGVFQSSTVPPQTGRPSFAGRRFESQFILCQGLHLQVPGKQKGNNL